VVFDLPNGSVNANAMTLDSVDKTLTFRGKVHVHINKVEKKGAPPPQVKAPEAPARVAPEAQVLTAPAGSPGFSMEVVPQ
jgi:lipopolysaccharide export system protein LptC